MSPPPQNGRRRRAQPLEDVVDLLLVMILVDEWTSRIPRGRLEGVDVAVYRQLVEGWVDQHQDEIGGAARRVREREGDAGSIGHVVDELWDLFFVWATDLEPDLLKKPGGMY